jgi:hypothetical protein
MEHYDIKRLALVFAIQAEIEAAKSRNREKNIDKNNPNIPTYSEDYFFGKAEELRELVNKHNEQL